MCGITFGEWQGIEGGAQARSLNVKVAKIATGLGYDRDWLMWGGPLTPDDEVAPEVVELGEDGQPITRRYPDDNRPAALEHAA